MLFYVHRSGFTLKNFPPTNPCTVEPSTGSKCVICQDDACNIPAKLLSYDLAVIQNRDMIDSALLARAERQYRIGSQSPLNAQKSLTQKVLLIQSQMLWPFCQTHAIILFSEFVTKVLCTFLNCSTMPLQSQCSV